MNDRIRISDADREQVTAQLRDHFAEGRLTSEELDERLTAALNAKTYGELRRVLADLPDPGVAMGAGSVTPPYRQAPYQRAPYRGRGRQLGFYHRPRILPLVLLALIATLVIPGVGWLFFAALKLVLVLFLVSIVAFAFIAASFFRRMRRSWRSAAASGWNQYQWHGYQWHW